MRRHSQPVGKKNLRERLMPLYVIDQAVLDRSATGARTLDEAKGLANDLADHAEGKVYVVVREVTSIQVATVGSNTTVKRGVYRATTKDRSGGD